MKGVSKFYDDAVHHDDPRHVPASIKRELMEEAGYRCAVPTCRGTLALELAHIEPWAETHDNAFDNLLVLCAVCHQMYDREKRIPMTAIRSYKQNLAVLNGRYNDFERRLLEALHERGVGKVITLDAGEHLDLSIRNIVRDGLVDVQIGPGGTWQEENGFVGIELVGVRLHPDVDSPRTGTSRRISGGSDEILLTPKGIAFVQRWFGGHPVTE